MTIDQILDFLGKHVDTIVLLIGGVLALFRVNVRSARETVDRLAREDVLTRAAKIAFQAVELAHERGLLGDQPTGVTKAARALELATQYAKAFGHDPSQEDTAAWKALFAVQARIQGATGGTVVDGVHPVTGAKPSGN